MNTPPIEVKKYDKEDTEKEYKDYNTSEDPIEKRSSSMSNRGALKMVPKR